MAAHIASVSYVLQKQSSTSLISSTVLDENDKIEGKSTQRYSQFWSAYAV